MKQIKVEYIKNEMISTKYGEKKKYSIKGSDGQWYDSWSDLSQINQGDTVSGLITTREYNGKTYYNFKLPNAEDRAMIALEERVKKLEETVFDFDDNKSDESTEDRNEAPPHTDDEVDIESIPFN